MAKESRKRNAGINGSGTGRFAVATPEPYLQDKATVPGRMALGQHNAEDGVGRYSGSGLFRANPIPAREE